MALPERFGNFILLEQFDVGSLGLDFRALKLSPDKPPTFFGLLIINEALTREEKTLKRLITEAKASAQLASPNILKLLGIGKVQDAYFISSPWQEGKSLKAVFRKSRREGFPLALDHALLIASKVARALELAHSRKFEGARYFHGSLFPSSIFLTYEGEVRLRGFAMWSALRDKARSAARWGAEESLYLAPEQIQGYTADRRSDLFTLGAILFEMLTGHPYFEKERGVDYPGRIHAAHLAQPPGAERPLSSELLELLKLLLAPDPEARLADTAEARQRIEKLLFRKEFQPTTFNLAFFMHSLFRAEIDEEGRTRKEEAERDYYSALASERTAPGAGREPAAEPREVPALPAPVSPRAAVVVEETGVRGEWAASGVASSLAPRPSESVALTRPSGASGPVKLERFELFESTRERSSPRVLLVSAVALLFAALSFLGYRYVRPVAVSVLTGPVKPVSEAGAPPVPAVPSSSGGEGSATAPIDYQAELARLREELERVKRAEPSSERERLRQEVRQEFEGKTDSLVAEELKRREKEMEDRFRRQQEEERTRIEQEISNRYQREQENLRRQAALEEVERQKAGSPSDGASPRTAEASPAASESPAPRLDDGLGQAFVPSPAAAGPPRVSVGELVSPEDPELVPPRPRKRVVPEYPPLAVRQGAEADVVVSALVSATGDVQDVRVVTGRKGNLRFDEAAVRAVRQYKFFPGTKRGVPVRVWFNVIVRFTL